MSRHRFLKNISDDMEDYDDDLGQDEFDEEVYLVYDTLIELIPDLTFEEIEETLIDYDYDVDGVINYFVEDAGIDKKLVKKVVQQPQPQQKQTPKANNNNNNNNNNNKQKELKNFPSSLAADFCNKVQIKSNILPNEQFTFQSLYNNNISQNDKIKPFTFDTPSNDDLILEKQRGAFKPKPNQVKNVTNNVKNIQINNNNNNNNSNNNSQIKPNTITNNKSIATPSINNEAESISTPKEPMKQHSDSRKKQLEEMVHKEFSRTDNKPHLNMVVVGHVDAGKSTTMGHLLFKLGMVDKRTMDKFEHDANRMGKSSFHFAWVLDEHQEERERGVTMDVCVRYFETPHRSITVLDAPGHRDFIPNMISGTTQADVAILLINASEFEAGFSTEGQTREHALLAKSLGIMQLIVAINKMDMVDFSETRYNYIVETLKNFLSNAKFNEKNVRFIPISGFTGEGLVDRKEKKMEWFKGATLIDYIDSFSIGERLINKPFRMNVNDIFKSTNKGMMSVGGKIEAGIVSQGDKILIAPGNEICKVKSIRRNHLDSEWGVGGDSVDITLLIENPLAIRVGSILCDPEHPIPQAMRFQAQIVSFVLPTPMTSGYQCVFHAHSMEEPATVSKLLSILDSNGQVSKKNPRCISDTTNAIVEVTLSRTSCLELYSNYNQLGRFTLRESGKTVAAGIITEFLGKKDKKKKVSTTTNK